MKIALTEKSNFWAAMNPNESTYVGGQLTGGGQFFAPDTQDVQIILTWEKPQSDDFVFEQLPKWAQTQIKGGLLDKVIVANEDVFKKIKTQSEDKTDVSPETSADKETEQFAKKKAKRV